MPKTCQLYTRMITQGGNETSTLHQTKKAFQRYPERFSKYCITYDKLINEIVMCYVLKSKLQLGWQISIYLSIYLYLLSTYIYIYIYIDIDIYI